MTFEDYVQYIMSENGYQEWKAKEIASSIIEHDLLDFQEILDSFIPNNMEIDEFKKIIKDMGYEGEWEYQE
jgi:hypothetical protein